MSLKQHMRILRGAAGYDIGTPPPKVISDDGIIKVVRTVAKDRATGMRLEDPNG